MKFLSNIKSKIRVGRDSYFWRYFLQRDFFIILLFSAIFLGALLTLDSMVNYEQQFSWLAHSFWQGKLYFIDHLRSYYDTVEYQGQYYWPLGPWPAILLMPFVALFSLLGLFFYQGYLLFFLVILVFWLIFKISRQHDYNFVDSWYLAYAFCFSSPFIGVALSSFSWYYAQAVAVFFSFWALVEFFGRKRYWLLGMIFGILFLTRVSTGLGIIFIVLDLVFSRQLRSGKIKKLVALSVPALTALGLLVLYNFFRFHGLFDEGYGQQILIASLAQARTYGLISFRHVPGNLYYLFFNGPVAIFRDNISHVLQFPFLRMDPWGLGIFFTAPYLLGIFFRKIRGRESWFLLFTSIIIAIPILLYYGIGFRQFGYRYALDFLPFIFTLFLINYRQDRTRLSIGLKTVIIVSSLFNLFLILHF